jgi:hypothetical protein
MEKRWRDFLTLAFDRVYVLRAEIVPGTATRGSSLTDHRRPSTRRHARQRLKLARIGALTPLLSFWKQFCLRLPRVGAICVRKILNCNSISRCLADAGYWPAGSNGDSPL